MDGIQTNPITFCFTEDVLNKKKAGEIEQEEK